jgi:EAL domain-containing protein (putative c-di-GMP-specific phosphodiesterase class I)
MTDRPPKRRKQPKPGLPSRVSPWSLFTPVLIVALAVAMYFAGLEWKWTPLLGGILLASVVSLVASVWKGRRQRRETLHFEQRLIAEVEKHRAVREQLERELALHQQDRSRLVKEVEARRQVESGRIAAIGMLNMLALHLQDNAFLVDRDRRYRFHTKRFSDWTGMPPVRIDGSAFEEVLPKQDAEALRPNLLEALAGRAGRAEARLTPHTGTAQPTLVEYLPQHDAAGNVSGVLVLITGTQIPAAPAVEHTTATAPGDNDQAPAHEPLRSVTEFVVPDGSGNAVYLSSLTEELSGWGNPRERIRQAIQNNGFNLYAQDIVALRTGSDPGVMHELLIRMRDEEQNLVPPGTFLPIAERFGMMPDIDRFVVRMAIASRAAPGLPIGAGTHPVLCINLSRASIEDPTFPAFVARTLQENAIPGGSLCFEIADSDAIACLSQASRFATELKPLGCRFSLDGFGRMGVGFDHVKALRLDFLKIDGSIILQVERVPEALAKVRAIQRVCKAIGIRTVAEMVESDASLEKLRSVEVDYAQGFGIDKPRPF